MLFIVDKGIRGGICNIINRYAKAYNKYMKDYERNKESSYLNYLDVNNLYGWAMSQKRPVKNLNGQKKLLNLIPDFIKNYNEQNDEG